MAILTLAGFLVRDTGESSDSGDTTGTGNSVVVGDDGETEYESNVVGSAQAFLRFDDPQLNFAPFNTEAIGVSYRYRPVLLPTGGDTNGDKVATGMSAAGDDKVYFYQRADGRLWVLESDGTPIVLSNTAHVAGTVYWHTFHHDGTEGWLRILNGKGGLMEELAVGDALGSSNWGSWVLGERGGYNAVDMTTRYSRLMVTDGEPEAPFLVALRVPTGDGEDDDLTPNDLMGPVWQYVSDIPYDTDTYGTSATSGHRHSFTLSAVPAAAREIVAARTLMRVRSPGGNSAFRLFETSQATEREHGSDLTPRTFDEAYTLMSPTDPATLAAWERANLNAVEVGIRLTASQTTHLKMVSQTVAYRASGSGTSVSLRALALGII